MQSSFYCKVPEQLTVYLTNYFSTKSRVSQYTPSDVS